MSAIIVPRRRIWTRQPPENIGIDRGAAAKYGAIYLSLANHPRICHDLVAEKNIVNPGGVANSAGGLIWTFNGAQQGNLPFSLPNGDVFPGSVLIGARVLASAAQAATPGHAFGLCVSSGTQSAIGVGFDSTGTKIGAAALTGNGAYINTYSTAVLNRFYDVFLNISPAGAIRAWIDGQPASTGQNSTSITGWNFSGWNEISIGAQHRSSGFLRNFKGSIEWSSLIYVSDQSQITDDLVADLYRSGYPYNLLKRRRRPLIFDLGAAGTLNASASGSANASGQADLSAQVGLGAVGISTGNGSGNLSAMVPLSGAGLTVVGGNGTLTATVTIDAHSLATAAGQAGLSAEVAMLAAAAARAAGNATLAAQLEAIAAGASRSSGTAGAIMTAPGEISAAGQANMAGQAALTVNVQLQAAGGAQVGGNADAEALAPGQIAAAGGAVMGGWASWSTLVSVTAAGFINAMGAGQMAIEIPLTAAGGSVAGGSAAATLLGAVHNFRLFSGVDRKTRVTAGAQRTINISHGVSHG